MWFYILNVFMIIFWVFIFKDKKKYMIVVTIQLFLVLALRSNELGPDLVYYKSGFELIKSFDIMTLISKLHFFKTASLVYPFKYESGYVVFNWIVSQLGFSYHFFLMICAAINMYTMYKFINKYSDMPWLSFIVLFTFGTYIYFFGILRHSLALCFVLLAMIKKTDNKKKETIVFMIIAFLFHRSSLVLLPLLLITNRQSIKKKNAIILLLATVPFLIFSRHIYTLSYRIMTFFGQGGYVGHSIKINLVIIFLYAIATIVIIFVDFDKMKNNHIFNITFIALILSIFFEIIGLYNDAMARSVQMYLTFLIILIPNVIKMYEKQKITVVIELVVIVLLTFYMCYRINDTEIVPYKMQNEAIIFDS